MKTDLRSWALLVILACIWGSSFLLMKRGMVALDGTPLFSDVQVGALRMAIAGTIMLPFGLRLFKQIKTGRDWFSLAIVGFCGNFFPAFLFTFAETNLSSGMAGMLNSFTPFFTLLLGWMIFKQGILLRQVLGLFTAFLGIVLLVGSESLIQTNFSWLHAGAVILATVFYATSLNTIKHRLGHVRSLDITALAFSLTAIPAWIVVYMSNTGEVVSTHPSAWEGLGFITILSAVGTCLAVFLFNRLIALKSAVFASSVTYIIPIVAVILGMIFLKESFHWVQLIGMFVIIGGVYVANNTVKRS